MTSTIPQSRRLYFIDGPARGQTAFRPRSPSRLTWDDEHGTAHAYRRVVHFRSAHFYRLAS